MPVQLLKALSPMVRTDDGMVTLVIPAQLLKALEAMLVTLYVTEFTTKDCNICISPKAEGELITLAIPESISKVYITLSGVIFIAVLVVNIDKVLNTVVIFVLILFTLSTT